MSPQRRTALVSVGAACALIAIKLAAGIPSGSLGLVSEALHSGTDLVAALLTFFAVGVAGRPADEAVEDIDYSETRDYVKRVLSNYWTYQALHE